MGILNSTPRLLLALRTSPWAAQKPVKATWELFGRNQLKLFESISTRLWLRIYKSRSSLGHVM